MKNQAIIIKHFLIICIIFGLSCKKESKNEPALKIGQAYQGGVIAYILQPGDPGYDANILHGLIATPSDFATPPPGIQWDFYSPTLLTGATSTALGSGYDNTEIIVTALGPGNFAAKLCFDLDLGGYNDWYLPSKDDLNKLFLNNDLIGGFYGQGTIWNYSYWSSSEIDQNNAWTQVFPNYGTQSSGDKYWTKSLVRPIRSF